MIKRVLSVLCALIIASSLVFVCSVPSEAASKREKQRTIAIVYDNSGSMFTGKSWCQATYAVEVFAAMMNKGDKLMIYPMQTLNVGGGSEVFSDEHPMIIEDGGESNLIRDIQTNGGNGTPVETVDRAYEGLRKESADERWLIILTDGTEFSENGVEMKPAETKQLLEKRISKFLDAGGVNIIYLGIGNMKKPSVDKPSYYADTAKDGSEVTAKLSEMCNIIFGRDELPGGRVDLSNKKVSFDVSMKKLIVFVQGEGISSIELKDSDGNSAGAKDRPFQTKYSERGRATGTGWTVDESLQGELVAFEGCRSGEYILSYSGKETSTKIYYEPEVDLSAKLFYKTEDGALAEITDFDLPISAGEYVVKLSLVDAEGKETKSDLLGNVQYMTRYTLNGKEYSSDKDEIPLLLNSGDELGKFDFSVTYLTDYTIEKDSAADLGWGSSHTVAQQDHEVKAICSESIPETINLSGFTEGASCSFKYEVDGVILEGQELDGIQPDFTVDGLALEYERTDSGYTVHVSPAGKLADTECKEYSITAAGKYTDEYGGESRISPVSVPFTIVNDGFAVKVELEAQQNYFVRSKLNDGKPLIAHISKDGTPLTGDELDGLDFTVDTGGVPCDLEKDPERSAILIKLKDSGSLKNGKYSVKCSASLVNNLGEETTGTDDASVEIRAYPKWLPYLIAFSILGLLVALIVFYMTRKVLPKSIRYDTSENNCMYLGRRVADVFVRDSKGKKTRRITINNGTNSYGINEGITLTLKAIDPRYIKSSKRAARVTGARFSSQNGRNADIGGTELHRKTQTDNTAVDMEDNSDLNIKIRNDEMIETTASVNGRQVRNEVRLVFK